MDNARYHQQLQNLYNKPVIYDSNVSNNDPDILTDDVMRSTNPFRNNDNENFAHDSYFTKNRDSRYSDQKAL